MHKEKPPLVSVIITCYNLGEYLDDAIGSIKTQTYGNYEIILVDDGSSDPRTISIVKGIKKNDPSINVIIQKNKGLSEARNVGIRKAGGKYIVCLDADDTLNSEYLNKTLAVFAADKSNQLGFVTVWVKEFGERDGLWKTSGFNPSLLLFENVVSVASIFKKEAWNKVGGYKEVMKGGYEDWEFWLSLVEHGYKWDIIEEPLFNYRIRDKSMLSDATKKHAELYARIVGLHEGLFIKYLKDYASIVADRNSYLREEIKQKKLAIANYESEIDEYKKIQEEYDQIRLSRVVAPSLRLRSKLLDIREKKARTTAAVKSNTKRITPKPVKKLAKYLLRKEIKQKTVIVSNSVWPSNKPLVSVIVPFYNQGDVIGDAIDSIKSQTYKNTECIIVNDGSGTEESSKLEEIVSGAQIKLIKHKYNKGKGSPAAARNSGVKAAKGKYIICLDGDDKLDSTYIEKCLLQLEAYPDIGLVTTDMSCFGASTGVYRHPDYDAMCLIPNNMVITAAMYKKEAWSAVGGYKEGIGYEDWEFWVSLAENGYFGKHIPEPLFIYRTVDNSRFISDRKKHFDHIQKVRQLHPAYSKVVRPKWRKHLKKQFRSSTESMLINMNNSAYYSVKQKKSILVALPWMVFGGAESLVINYCNGIKDEFDIHFITGLRSDNPWEYKFKEVSPNIYHLPELLSDEFYLEFISNYIETRAIDVLHVIHTDFLFPMLSNIKERHPNLAIVLTMFNDRVPHYFWPSIKLNKYIDVFTSDNKATANHYKQELPEGKKVIAIPNGVDCLNKFNPDLFNRDTERLNLGIGADDVAVFFIGRLSEEKNPDVFLDAASDILSKRTDNLKFFIIGDGQMRQEIEQTLKSLATDKVKYLGYQSDIPKYLSAADIFILPSAIEGFPTSILEAMAMEVAVIASDVGAVSDVITDGADGIIVKPGSKKEIAQAIMKLSDDDQFLKSIKDTARQRIINKYSLQKLAENYSTLYKDSLKKK